MLKKLLLVEDEAILALSEAKMLEKHGYAVATVYSGEKAVEAVAADGNIDLILMDIDLGKGMDGTEAAQKILETHDLPIAFLSSHTEPEIVEKTEGITSYGYIVKNSGDTVLLASIRMAFRLYNAHMELKTREENLHEALIRQEQAEEELLEKSAELDRYFSSSLDLLCIANLQGEFVRLNPEWERVLGYPHSEIEGRSFMDFVHEDDRAATLEALGRLEQQNTVQSFENRYRCKDGSYRWIEWRSKPQGDMIYAVARDITDRKLAEVQLRESEEKFRTLMTQTIDMIFLHDLKGRIIDVNEVGEWNTGYSRDELLSMSIPDLDPDYYTREDSGRFWEQIGYNEPFQFQVRLRRKNGSVFHVELVLSKVVINNKTVIMTFSRDITERLEANAALRESEEKYRMLYENAPLPYQSLDRQGCFLDVNPTWLQALGGYTREEVIGRSFAEFIHPDCLEDFRRNLEAFKKEGTAEHNLYKMRKKDGEYIDAVFKGCIAYSPEGDFQRTHCVFEDITEKKQYEEAAEKREVFYRNLLENSIDAIYLLSREGRVLDVNQTACVMLGYSREELLACSIDDIDVNYPSQKFIEFWNEKPEGATILFESTHIRKDGTSFPVEVNGIFFLYKGEKYLYGVARDIRERKRRDKELRKLSEDFTNLVENASDMVARFDPEFRHIYVNRAIERHAKTNRKDILGKTPVESGMQEEQARFIINALKVAAESLEEHWVEQAFSSSAGEEWIETRIVPELGEDGQLESILAISRDITAHKQTERALREREQQTKRILDSISDGIVVLDPNYRVISVNRKLREDVGAVDEVQLIGKKCYAAFYGFDKKCEWCPTRKVLKTGEEHSVTVPYPAEGPQKWFHLLASPVYDAEGNIVQVVESARDITSRMNADKEKDELMRELNHRVKNNLLMISALIRLKDDSLGPEVDLSDIDRQITAIRLIHEKLYKTENVAFIDMRDYIEEILSAVFTFHSGPVERQIDIAKITMDTKKAVAVGLIVNEIATNAVKHGFTSENAEFKVEMAKDKRNNEYVLILRNTGSKFPKSVNIHTPQSLGLQLINSLVSQLNGSIELARTPSTSFGIRFPVAD